MSDNIRRDETKRAFSFYKEGGKIYDKWAIDFQDRYPELCNEIKTSAKSEIVENMIKANFSNSDIMLATNLPEKEIQSIRKTL